MTKLIAGGSGKDNMKKKKKEISRNMLRNDYLNNPLNGRNEEAGEASAPAPTFLQRRVPPSTYVE